MLHCLVVAEGILGGVKRTVGPVPVVGEDKEEALSRLWFCVCVTGGGVRVPVHFWNLQCVMVGSLCTALQAVQRRTALGLGVVHRFPLESEVAAGGVGEGFCSFSFLAAKRIRSFFLES